MVLLQPIEHYEVPRLGPIHAPQDGNDGIDEHLPTLREKVLRLSYSRAVMPDGGDLPNGLFYYAFSDVRLCKQLDAQCKKPVVWHRMGGNSLYDDVTLEAERMTSQDGRIDFWRFYGERWMLQASTHLSLLGWLRFDIHDATEGAPDDTNPYARAEIRIPNLRPIPGTTGPSWWVLRVPLFRPHQTESRFPVSGFMDSPEPLGTIDVTIGFEPLVDPDTGVPLPHAAATAAIAPPVNNLAGPATILDENFRRIREAQSKESLKEVLDDLVGETWLLRRALGFLVVEGDTGPFFEVLFRMSMDISHGRDRISKRQWARGLAVLWKYCDSKPKFAATVDGSHVTDQSFLSDALGFMECANGAYDAKSFFGHATAAVAEVAQVEVNDKDLVAHLATSTRKDIIKDAVSSFHYAKSLGGIVHSAIFNAADNVANRLVPVLVEQIKNYGIERIVITGHSLGGGAAALLTMILDQQHMATLQAAAGGSPITVEGWAFASPPVCSQQLAEQFRDKITTIVNEHDVVTRLSYGAVEELVSCMIAAEHIAPKGLFVTSLRDREFYPKLWLPGTVYQTQLGSVPIVSQIPVLRLATNAVTNWFGVDHWLGASLYRVDARDLQGILLQPNLLFRHASGSYLKALKYAKKQA
ncbi:hypothetical protein GGF32_007012 [Allomyces javanicus]|nr:hypothetical protein GGF32_007012 [Allomyces javanicus]